MRTINLIRYISAIAVLLSISKVQAQEAPGTGGFSDLQTNSAFEAPKITKPSPSVAALMRFEEIPVDGYSGIPSISIPIFQSETSSEKVALNISLNYHVTGIAPEEVASFTGLGWSLMAGGTISRTVKGTPDELYQPGGAQGRQYAGIYYRPQDQYGAYSNAYYSAVSPANDMTKNVSRYKWEAFEQNKFDTEHDLYQYNVMGTTGRFYIKMDTISKQLNIIKLDDNRHKIELDYEGPDFSEKLIYKLNRFTITNTEGIKFEFAEKEMVTNAEGSNVLIYFNDMGDIAQSFSPWGYPSAFHLTKVMDESGNILLEYDYSTYSEKVLTFQKTVNETSTNLQQIFNYPGNIGWEEISENYTRVEPKNVISQTNITTDTKKINKITITGLGQVLFEYSGNRTDSNLPTNSGAVKLDRIIVKDLNNQPIKRMEFIYDYFNIPNFSPKITVGSIPAPNHVNRLILKEVKEYGGTSSQFNKYELKYKPVQNPLNKEIIKNPWGYLELNDSSLSAKLFATTGALQEIAYPTGGKIVYEFEPNTYTYRGDVKISNEEFQANPENLGLSPNSPNFKEYLYGGGIRIKEIKTINNDAETVGLRKYEYKEFDDNLNKSSSGSLVFYEPKFEYYHTKQNSYMKNGKPEPISISLLTKTETNNLSYSRNQGTDVGYQFVRVLDVNPNNQATNGRTDMVFRAPQEHPELNDDGYSGYPDGDKIEYPFVPFKNSDFKRGQLKESMTYDENGNILTKTENEYSIKSESELITGIKMFSYDGCAYAWDFKNFAAYLARYNSWLNNPGGVYKLCGYPASHITIYPIRDNMGWLQLDSQKSTEYFYEGNSQKEVSSVSYFTYEEFNQQPKTKTITNSLNEELKVEYFYPHNLTQNHEQEEVMESMIGKNMINTPIEVKVYNDNVVTSEKRTWYENVDGAILPKSVYIKKGEMGTNVSNSDRKITYDKYDSKGNLLQYTLENGIPVAIIWGYNGQYPIAKVEGRIYDQVISLFDSLVLASNDNALTADSFASLLALDDVMVIGYVYQPLVGVTAIVQSNGLKELYEYDDFGRLKTIRDQDLNILKTIDYHYQNPQP